MPPSIKNKTFKIPFSGGKAVIVIAVKYTLDMVYEQITVLCTEMSANGTTVRWDSNNDMNMGVTVSDGVMTVTLTWVGVTVTDCRCCVIPGDPFAQ